MEELNETACDCFQADLDANSYDKEMFNCFEAENFGNLEERLPDLGPNLTKAEQGEIMADSLIRYSIKNCDAMQQYFVQYRNASLERNKKILENSNLSRQLLWDSTHTALNMTKAHYGMALYIFNEKNKARQVLEEITTEDPNYESAAGFLAWAYEDNGDYSEAHGIYKDLVQRYPDNYEYALLLEMVGRKLK